MSGHWRVLAQGGDLLVTEREECSFFTIPTACIPEVLEKLLRSISAGPGEPAAGAREILSGFEQEIEDYEPDICGRRWPEGRWAA